MKSRRNGVLAGALSAALIVVSFVQQPAASVGAVPNAGGTILELEVAGRGGVDAGASAAVLNVASARSVEDGHVIAWPCGDDRPTAATLNYRRGEAVSNATVVGIGADGNVCLWTSSTTDLVVDVNAAFDASNVQTFVPSRLLDTRTAPTAGGGGSGRFETLPPGSTLPSGAECALRVRPTPEDRPSNAIPNATPGTKPHALYPRVDGNFVGTTDEILQWVACKWGIDEDLVRAQAAKESWWNQSNLGDRSTDQNACHPVLRTPGSPCPESVGMLQVRFLYHSDAFEDLNALRSTSYNADYTYENWRRCFEGEVTWLNDVERGRTYGPGDARGCLALWFTGRWYVPRGDAYLADIDDYLARRIWELPEFEER